MVPFLESAVDTLDRELIDWHTRKHEYHDEEDRDYWGLCKPRVSLRIWKMLEGLRNPWSGQWSFLPCEGGLLDQPEWLMHDLVLISEYSQMIKAQLQPGLDKS